MRRLTELGDPEIAQGFVNLLKEKNIDAQFIPSKAGKQVIWIMDDENLHAAVGHLELFLKNPQPAPIQAQKSQDKEQSRQKDRVRSVVFRDDEPARGATLTLILVSVFVYILREGGNSRLMLESLYISDPRFGGGELFLEILNGEIWRVITPIFLHFHFIHILFNMLWLYQLGSLIETIDGPQKLILIVFLTGALSNILQYVLKGPAFGGMSGVIYGLLSFAWAMGRWHPQSGYYIDKGTFGFMMVWLVLCFLGIFGPVANFAHLGGLLVGFGLAKLPQKS